MTPPQGLGGPVRAVRGLIFIALMYLLLLFMGLACMIPSWLSRRWAMVFIHAYCDAVMWMLRVIVGTRCEVRGELPSGPCLIAAKHQSFLDIIILTRALPQPAFVMKKSIRYVPVLGVYAERLGSIPIDRSDGGKAMRAMLQGAGAQAAGRQLIIFVQGTRVPPGADVPYRAGVLKLRQQTGLPVHLVALNTGWFWPRTGIRRTPGTAVVEFVGIIPPGGGLDIAAISGPIEAASERLAEAASAEVEALR